uniref:RNA helicase n=1 Tax=Panagrellus redivivus TaxID=6233 RepID=A0A7E4UL57_PANRE
MPKRGLFNPYTGYVQQPRNWLDIHEHNVDSTDIENPITDFESAVKLYDSLIRLDLHFHESRAVYAAKNIAFSITEEHNKKIMFSFDAARSDFTLNVNDHVFIEVLKNVNGFCKRWSYAAGSVRSITEYIAEVDVHQYFNKVEIDTDQLCLVCNKVNYGMYGDQLKAIDVVKEHSSILQKLAYGEQIVTESEPETFDDGLEFPFDTDQKLALKQMTSAATTTFVLIGPPGTGKTTIIIQAIARLVEKGKRILVATSSNIAADAFTNRFLERCNDNDCVFRLMKATRDFSKTDDKMKVISGFENCNGEWEYRPPDSVDRYSVVITTLGMSYKLRTMCEKEFSHIFIDEAGEASELNLWMFLANRGKDKNTRLILCGDTTLLGPQNDVEQLNKYNSAYKKSMLQRLVETPQFKSDPRLMVRLSMNYRLHKSIVDVMSAMIEDPITTSENYTEDVNLSNITSQTSSRVIFQNVKSEYEEMKQILEYYVKLQNHFSDTDIGIITPHKSQAALIQEKVGLESKVMIDAVQQFRGAQRRVVIISCTLDSDNLVHLKIDPEWINMAISRAQSLVIIIGRASAVDVLPEGKLRSPGLDEALKFEALTQ